MPSHLVAEDTLHDSLAEYAAVLDHFAPSPAFYTDKFASFVVEQEAQNEEDDEEEEEDIEYSADIFSYIATETAQPLTQHVPDKDIEAIVNLVVYILLQQQDGSESSIRQWFEQLISAQQFGDKIYKNKKKTLKLLSLISNLSAVYNLEVSVELKKWVLAQILSLVEVLDDAKILKPLVQTLQNGELNTEENDAEYRSLVVKTSKLYSSVDELESLKLLKLVSKQSPQLIEEYIIQSLNSTKTLDLTYITKDESLSSEKSPLTTLLNQYHTLTTKEFAPLIQASTNKQLDTTTIIQKNKILTLLSLAQQSQRLEYATIAQELSLANDQEVELVLFDALKRGALEGKMSQVDRVFHVHAVKVFIKTITKEDWTQIKEKLLEHKKALNEVKKTLTIKKNNNKN